MKHSAKRVFRSCVSLLLVLSLLCSLSLTALADEGEDHIVYVSMGDSMTNGYCLAGYDGESGAVNYGLDSYANQFAAYLAGYTGTIADDQVIFTGTRGTVDHRPLAISGMRSQDIQWALELDYQDQAFMDQYYAYDCDNNSWSTVGAWWNEQGLAGDRRTWGDFVDRNYRYADAAAKILAVYGEDSSIFQSSYADAAAIENAKNGIAANPYYPEGDQVTEIGNYLQIATEYFQESVKAADIISLGVGNTNFGTFMLTAVMDVLMKNDMSFSSNFSLDQAMVQAQKNDFALAKVNAMLGSQEYATIEAYLAALGSTEEQKTEIRYILKYSMVTFITGYVGLLDAILEDNPDVEIIMVALMNAYESADGTVESGSLGELVQVLYGPVNAMLEKLPAELVASKDAATQAKYSKAKFYFAEAPYVSCMVDVFGDDFYTKNGKYVEYEGPLYGTEGYTANTASVVRDRFAQEIVNGNFLFRGMGITVPQDYATFLQGAIDYDMKTGTAKAAFAAQNADAAKLYAMYLGFESALIYSGTENVDLTSLSSFANASALFAPAMAEILARAGEYSEEDSRYEAVAPVVSQIAEGAVSEQDVVDIMYGYEFMKDEVWAAFEAYHATLEQLKHPTIDHVIQCETCMDGTGHGNEGDAILQQVVAVYNEQLALLPYTVVAEMVQAQLGDSDLAESLITTELIKALCETEDSAGYKDVVYALVIRVAAEDMGYELTAEDVDTLLAEDGEFALAAKFTGQDAEVIKLLYENGMLDSVSEGASEKIELLQTVREGIAGLLAAESTIRSGAAGVPAVIDGASQLAYLLALPYAMGDVLCEDSNVQGGLTMIARCVLGTGAGGHPSSMGHDSLFEAVKKVRPVHEHEYVKGETTPPTCTEEGYTTYTCSCGKSYTDDYVDPAHTWDEGVFTKDPTTEETGIRTYTCTVCGETKDEVADTIGVIQRVYGQSRTDTAIAVADAMKEALELEMFDAVILANGEDKNFADALTGSYLANAKKAPILLYRSTGLSQATADYIAENLVSGGTVYLLGGELAIPATVETELSAAGYAVQRLAGGSRFDTNLAILEAAGVNNQEILIARGFDFADSLSASATGLPILVVNEVTGRLTEAQVEFLQAHKRSTMTILGGTVAISEALEAEIESVVGKDVGRVFGTSREETSVAIAERYFPDAEFAVLAYSRTSPDGLCGGPLAYAMKAPLVLVNAGKEAVTNGYVTENGIKDAFVLGGDLVIKDKTIKAIFELPDSAGIEEK